MDSRNTVHFAVIIWDVSSQFNVMEEMIAIQSKKGTDMACCL
jgi:hypothetical protein